MADFNPVFEIDSGALLAKLHLAGAQQAPNAVIVNTGVENPPDKPDPANLGKTKFVLDSKTGSYQVAAISWMAFKPKIVPEKLEELAKLEKQLADAYEKAGKSLEAGGEEDEKKSSSEPEEKDNRKEEDAHSKESLTAKTKDEDDKQPKKESIQTKLSLMKLLFEDDAEDGEKEDPEVEKAEKACYDFYNSFQAKMTKKPKLDEDDFLASRKSFYEAIQEENKLRAGDTEEAKLQLKKTAAKELKTYFETFAGKENVKNLDEKSMAIYLVGVGDGQAKVSDFADIVSDDRSRVEVADKREEVDKAIEEAQSDEKKANEDIRCYAAVVAGFQIDLD